MKCFGHCDYAYLLDDVTLSELDELGVSEGGDDLAAGDEGEALDAVEVGVLDGHDALVGEKLLGVVVDELAVDEHVDVVLADQVHLVLHLLLLGDLWRFSLLEKCSKKTYRQLFYLNLRDLCDVLHAHARPEDLDLVCVHGGVGDQDLGVLDPLGLVGAGGLVQDEA